MASIISSKAAPVTFRNVTKAFGTDVVAVDNIDLHVEAGKLVGIVSIRDLYAAVKTQLESDLKHHEAFIFDTGYGGS